MAVDKPPYRADIVGSFLRPDSVKKARKAHLDDKTISAEELAAVEDEAIRDVIRMQEDAGLKAVTDGEFRRAWWHFDFMGMLDGLDIVQREGGGIQFHGTATKADVPTITGKLGFPADHPMLEHFKFVAAQHQGDAEDLDPRPQRDPLPHRRGRHCAQGVQARRRGLLRRHHRDLQGRGEGLLRRRLPLPADRRHLLCLPLRSQDPRRRARTRARTPTG